MIFLTPLIWHKCICSGATPHAWQTSSSSAHTLRVHASTIYGSLGRGQIARSTLDCKQKEFKIIIFKIEKKVYAHRIKSNNPAHIKEITILTIQKAFNFNLYVKHLWHNDMT
jgi:hypothetical protein